MFRMWIVSGSSGYVSANHHISYIYRLFSSFKNNIEPAGCVCIRFAIRCCFYSLTSIGMEVVNVGVSNSSCFFIFNICGKKRKWNGDSKNIENCAYCPFSLSITENIRWTLLKALPNHIHTMSKIFNKSDCSSKLSMATINDALRVKCNA